MADGFVGDRAEVKLGLDARQVLEIELLRASFVNLAVGEGDHLEPVHLTVDFAFIQATHIVWLLVQRAR